MKLSLARLLLPLLTAYLVFSFVGLRPLPPVKGVPQEKTLFPWAAALALTSFVWAQAPQSGLTDASFLALTAAFALFMAMSTDLVFMVLAVFFAYSSLSSSGSRMLLAPVLVFFLFTMCCGSAQKETPQAPASP